MVQGPGRRLWGAWRWSTSNGSLNYISPTTFNVPVNDICSILLLFCGRLNVVMKPEMNLTRKLRDCGTGVSANGNALTEKDTYHVTSRRTRTDVKQQQHTMAAERRTHREDVRPGQLGVLASSRSDRSSSADVG